MTDKFSDSFNAVQIDNKKQWKELKELCEINNIRLVQYGERKFRYPVECLITIIKATGQAILCPSKDSSKECALRGWKIMNFESFKECI